MLMICCRLTSGNKARISYCTLLAASPIFTMFQIVASYRFESATNESSSVPEELAITFSQNSTISVTKHFHSRSAVLPHQTSTKSRSTYGT